MQLMVCNAGWFMRRMGVAATCLPLLTPVQIWNYHFLKHLYVLYSDKQPKYILDAGACTGPQCACGCPACAIILWRCWCVFQPGV